MPKTVCQSVAWFKRYKTLKSVTVGSLNLRKFSYSAKTRSAFGLARNKQFANIQSLHQAITSPIHMTLFLQTPTYRVGLGFTDGVGSFSVVCADFCSLACLVIPYIRLVACSFDRCTHACRYQHAVVMVVTMNDLVLSTKIYSWCVISALYLCSNLFALVCVQFYSYVSCLSLTLFACNGD